MNSVTRKLLFSNPSILCRSATLDFSVSSWLHDLMYCRHFSLTRCILMNLFMCIQPHQTIHICLSLAVTMSEQSLKMSTIHIQNLCLKKCIVVWLSAWWTDIVCAINLYRAIILILHLNKTILCLSHVDTPIALPRTCDEIRQSNPTAKSGTYVIDPDFRGPARKLEVRN